MSAVITYTIYVFFHMLPRLVWTTLFYRKWLNINFPDQTMMYLAKAWKGLVLYEKRKRNSDGTKDDYDDYAYRAFKKEEK